MKKKFITLGLVLCLGFLCIGLTGCFGPKIEKLEIEYTPNIQFFVGEEWEDDQIKGTATYSDDTTKDVTTELNIDKSKYDKTKVGKYDIVFEYEGLDIKYQVEVVNEMTNIQSISKRIAPCFENAFKAKNGVLEFSAIYSEELDSEAVGEEGVYAKQTIQYKLENNTIKEYYKLEYTDNADTGISLVEILYVGNTEEGTMTYKLYDAEGGYYIVDSDQGTLADFESVIPQTATEYGASIYLDASQWLNFYAEYYPNLTPSKLTKLNNVYTLTLSNNSTVVIDTEGFISSYGEIEFSKTTDIPSELTAA